MQAAEVVALHSRALQQVQVAPVVAAMLVLHCLGQVQTEQQIPAVAVVVFMITTLLMLLEVMADLGLLVFDIQVRFWRQLPQLVRQQ